MKRTRLSSAPGLLLLAPPVVGFVPEAPRGRLPRPGWYKTARWRRLRLRVLDRDRWICQQTGVLLVRGRVDPCSAVVDHRVPHRWNPELFWDVDNLQSVAKGWHDSDKQKAERGQW